MRAGFSSRGQRDNTRDSAQPQLGKVREVRAGLLERMVERVRAGITESLGVGERADADGIEHD